MRYLLPLVLGTLLCGRGHSQENGISLKVDLVAWGDAIPGLSLKSGSAATMVTALSFRYSTPISYSGPPVMEIYKGSSEAGPNVSAAKTDQDKDHQMAPLLETDQKAQDETAEGSAKSGLALELANRRKKDTSLVALVPLPSGSRRVTVLLAPAAGGTYRGYVINDDPSELPMGKLRIHNLSPYLIAMRCNGKAAKEIKGGESFLSEVPGEQFIYELAYKLGNQWKFQENNVFPVRQNEQAQLIVLQSDNRFFQSSDGAGSGFLQLVTLLRTPSL